MLFKGVGILTFWKLYTVKRSNFESAPAVAGTLCSAASATEQSSYAKDWTSESTFPSCNIDLVPLLAGGRPQASGQSMASEEHNENFNTAVPHFV